MRSDTAGCAAAEHSDPDARIIRHAPDLELLDPGEEDERALLIEARHREFADALQGDDDVILGGEPVNPRLHMAMHQVVANQVLAGNPPETWQTVQRLAGLGYDWHNIMHMIVSLITQDVCGALREHRQPGPAAYARRLSGLPGDWPPPGPARQARCGSAAVDRGALATRPLRGMTVCSAQWEAGSL